MCETVHFDCFHCLNHIIIKLLGFWKLDSASKVLKFYNLGDVKSIK
jgi:hypothetical protein